MMLKGIDVSEHQGAIDWSQVKASGVQFTMIRGGYGRNNVDKYFHANAKGATAAVLQDVNWIMVLSASALAGILSLATSVAGIPEVPTETAEIEGE